MFFNGGVERLSIYSLIGILRYACTRLKFSFSHFTMNSKENSLVINGKDDMPIKRF